MEFLLNPTKLGASLESLIRKQYLGYTETFRKLKIKIDGGKNIFFFFLRKDIGNNYIVKVYFIYSGRTRRALFKTFCIFLVFMPKG